MTALFVVVFTRQWLETRAHGSALAGLGCSVLCLLLFGPDRFIIPAMLFITVSLLLMRKAGTGEGQTDHERGEEG